MAKINRNQYRRSKHNQQRSAKKENRNAEIDGNGPALTNRAGKIPVETRERNSKQAKSKKVNRQGAILDVTDDESKTKTTSKTPRIAKTSLVKYIIVTPFALLLLMIVLTFKTFYFLGASIILPFQFMRLSLEISRSDFELNVKLAEKLYPDNEDKQITFYRKHSKSWWWWLKNRSFIGR